MKPYDKNDFLLKKVYSDGSEEDACIYRIEDIEGDWHMGRRGFLSATGMALSLLFGKGTGFSEEKKDTSDGCGDDIVAHRSNVNFLAFGNNDKVLVSKSPKDGVKFWEMPSGKQIRHLKNIPANSKIAVSRSSEAFIILGHAISLYKTAKVPETPLQLGKKGARTVVIGSKLAAVASESLMVYSAENGKLFTTLSTGGSGRISALALSDDERILAGATYDKILLWNIENGVKIGQLKKERDQRLITMAFDPLGMFLITVTKKGLFHSVNLYDAVGGRLLKTISKDREITEFIEFSEDGCLITGTKREPPGLYNLPSLTPSTIWHEQEIEGPIAISRDKTLMAAANGKGGITVLSLPENKILTCLFDPDALKSGKKAGSYTYTDQYGRVITSTAPCGSPIPPGAICTCNCVPGGYTIGGSICSCNQICTCIPIK